MKRLLGFVTSLTPQGWAIIGGVVLLIALAVFAAIRIGNHAVDRTLDTATRAGATAAVATGQAQTLDQLKDANHAQQDLRSSGERSAARYSQCLLDSTDPAACQRYNPDAPAQ